jgi:predicted DsbA family dithiol-disulfide isomerase
VDIAAAAGLDADGAREVLATNSHADEVRADEAFFQRHGIHAVPAIIIERRHLISGGQPIEVFERALREIAAAKRD